MGAVASIPFLPTLKKRTVDKLKMLLAGCGVGVGGGAGLAVASTQLSPILGAAAVAGAGVAGCMLLWPGFGLLAVAGSIPLERIGRLTEDFSSFTVSLSRIVGLIALAGLIFHLCLRRIRLRFGLAFWLYAGYTLVAATTIVHAFYQKDAIRDSFRVLGNLIFFFYIINAVRSLKLARAGIVAWLVVSTGAVAYSVYDYHFGTQSSVEESEMGMMSKRFTSVVNDDSETRTLGTKVARVYGTTSHPTLFGLNLTMTLPFFAYLIRTQRLKWKILLFLGMLAVCYGIILSNTRAVMLLAVVTLLATVLRGLWALSVKTIAGLVVFGLVLTPLIPQDFYLRTLDPALYSTKNSDSIRVRFKYWEKSWELIQQHWLTGIGIGDQTTIVNMVTDETAGRITPDGLKASAHNEYIWVMVEVGIFGYIFHWSFVGLVVWASFKSASLLRRNPQMQEHYWLMIAAQITLLGVLAFAVQTEAFHFALKGWWFSAGLSWVMLGIARKQTGLPTPAPEAATA